ncbi:carboxypeptidase regulatory-like domain-containing protein [Paenibacillus sp. UNC496MF]|uniref:carboxypeptidase regulatory-like domain-containing protein n=1 Tax=Paenibacillus sp. UNC496MF TaxID=1502753 RepID=UPI000B864D82|nr:carboxypeptidase regulatory-like domain-containing protein [Paenibacillus sp. UNC496MF]
MKIEVFDTHDNSLIGGAYEVSINGTPGAVQYLQFPTSGQRRLVVRARAANGESDREVALLDVIGEPLTFASYQNGKDIAMIGVTQLPTNPYTAVLFLGSSVDTRSPHLLGTAPTVSPRPDKPFALDSTAVQLAGKGALSRVMLANSQALRQVETKRLVNTRLKPATAPAERLPLRRPPQATTRRMVGAVYDLTAIDVKDALKRAATTTPLEYEWDFGDGTKATTRTPMVSHDYFAAIDHAAGVGQFTVSCWAKASGILVKRTLTIHSAYAICKRGGTVVPHTSAELFARKRYNMLSGTFTVHNVEDEPIVLDRFSVTPNADDAEGVALPRPFVALRQPVTVAPRSKSMIGVNVPFVADNPQAGELRYDVKGFSVLYAGTSGAHPVRCGVAFDVPVPEWNKKPEPLLRLPEVPNQERKPWPWEIVQGKLDAAANPILDASQAGHAMLDAKTGTLAVSLGTLNGGGGALSRDKAMQVMQSVFAPAEAALETKRDAAPAAAPLRLRKLQPEQLAPKDIAVRPLPNAPVRNALNGLGGVHALSGPPLPGMIAEGQICDPDNLTEDELAKAEKGQLVCQLTSETTDVTMPARWMNARKGDVILSPGGDGIIGGLMLNVRPAQWYSHSGIMTRNYDEITHSTGSQKRLMDHLVGIVSGSDGFDPHVLKYIWPGAITQTVQHAIEGEDFPDPEYDKTYSVSAFGPHTVGVTHNDKLVMIPPLVLKPDPMQETPAVRTALHAIATDARNDAGRPGVKPKYHYRWYCYTDPTIGQGEPEGPDAGWAAGTHPSVCSSYIWMHAKARGAHLETSQALVTPTDLEPEDIATEATVRPTTPDGLYTYSAQERSDAAYWLYDTVYNQAYELAGWFGEILTDGADDVANQFLNAFANDDADGKDSTAWQNVTDADAVSPDDMLWWDGPALGGLYGFAEPAIYREPRVESYTVSRWKKVLSRGTVHGHVYADGAPVAGALVQVFDGKSAFTGGDGGYSLKDVPLGDYQLRASKTIDGNLYAAQVHIGLHAEDLVADVQLQPPSDRFRLAQVFIDFWGRDEENFGSDEIKDPGPEYFELELGPDKLVNTATRTYKWGGEVRLEYKFTVRLLLNNTIDVEVQGTLYEGTSEDNHDLDGQGGLTFQAGVGQTTGATLTITNTDEDDDDAGVLSISVKNVRNTN